MPKNTKPKVRYRLRNWSKYNAALVQRGSLTLWCDEAALANWCETSPTGRPGRPRTYSELAIQCMLTLGAIYHLPLRATVGLVRSLLPLLDAPALPVAHWATLSRRAATLHVRLPVSRGREPLALVLDATGLKVYGAGEWRRRQHGWTKHRTWRKLHLAVDAETLEVRALALSGPTVGDGQLVGTLLAQEPAPLARVTGDGAYATRAGYGAVARRAEHPRAIFPPQRERRAGRPPRPDRGHERPAGSRRYRGYALHTWQHGNAKAPPLDRDQHVRRIRQVGRRRWKAEVDYHQRSLAETTIFRFKTLFGPALHAHGGAQQLTEVCIRGAALNRMTALGLPDSYPVLVA